MKSLRVIIVIFGEEQWLDIAQAIHTIEMIPKSMILIENIEKRLILLLENV